jgi:hypothetical protein
MPRAVVVMTSADAPSRTPEASDFRRVTPTVLPARQANNAKDTINASVSGV